MNGAESLGKINNFFVRLNLKKIFFFNKIYIG